MTKRQGRVVPSQPPMTIRHGEGEAVGVSRISKSADGKSVILGINLASAPVPGRKYVANQVGVVSDEDEICLLFGQSNRDRNAGLRSLLEIHMSREGVGNFVAVLEQVDAGLKSWSSANKLKPRSLVTIDKDAPQTVALSANFVAVAYAGSETTLDFYMASSFALDQIVKQSRDFLNLEPMVRVNLPSRWFLSLVERVLSIGGQSVEREKEAT